MRRIWSVLGCGLVWLTTLGVGALESCCVWVWLSRTVYLERWGAAGNPYAAEEAAIAGFCALLGALPTLLLLILTGTLTLRLLGRRGCASHRKGHQNDTILE